MSAQINSSLLREFIVKTVGSDKIAHSNARGFGIDEDKFQEVNENDNNYIEVDEILDDDDLYAQFASMFEEEQEAKAESEDADKDRKNKVEEKSGSGAA